MTERARQAWSEDGVVARLLSPIARIWGAVAGARMRKPPTGRIGVPVVVVGNFTVGGAGKTPTVAALIELARGRGHSPWVVTRGYGGRTRGPLLVDPSIHDAALVGDEALLHARLTPTIVARDRLAGAREAERLGATCVLLDDGFQNPRLAKDLALIVVDGAAGIGNGRVLPAGPLRAPIETQIEATDALLVIDSGEPRHPSTDSLIATAEQRNIPVFGARIAPWRPEAIAGRRVVAYAGIGRPAKFAATLASAGAQVVDLVAFPDHHPFDCKDATRLLERAAAADADLVTTAKDAVRLVRGEGALGRLAATTRVLDIGLRFDAPAEIEAFIGEVVDGARAGSA
ncbi:MAG: tetraacyldisaccharide 4'-kinase [Hyphomicrobiales bacterium]|nr:tetraacyldisaccharide 4'-kinase [Hyphomicrobiales bacterium]